MGQTLAVTSKPTPASLAHHQWPRPSRRGLLGAARIALPASLAAMVTPLLGIVDTAVLARGGTAADIAGVALASAVIAILYWTLGFLRMAVAGLTAQADGRNDEAASRAHLVQGLAVGIGLGLILALAREPLADLALRVMTTAEGTSAEAGDAMRDYLSIRLMAAPCAIAMYAGIGWLSGQGRTALMMVVVVLTTMLNGALDVIFVLNEGMGTRGIAIGTALAEATGALLLGVTIAFVLHRRGGLGIAWSWQKLTERWRAIVSLNTDILIRTLFLSSSFAFFARAGGQFGDLTLAANQVLLQIVLAVGLTLDGPAIAAEAAVGKAIGRPNRQARTADFYTAVVNTGTLTVLVAIVGTLGLALGANALINLIVSNEPNAAALSGRVADFYMWAAISPLILALPYFLDGVFIGATRGKALRNGMGLSVGMFATSGVVLTPMLGNHGLWLAFTLFMLARGLTLLAAWRGFRVQLAR